MMVNHRSWTLKAWFHMERWCWDANLSLVAMDFSSAGEVPLGLPVLGRPHERHFHHSVWCYLWWLSFKHPTTLSIANFLFWTSITIRKNVLNKINCNSKNKNIQYKMVKCLFATFCVHTFWGYCSNQKCLMN